MTNRQMSEIIRRQKPTTLRPTATVQAASDLYGAGSIQYAAVAAAWSAVSVG